jgi:hypothetical protein
MGDLSVRAFMIHSAHYDYFIRYPKYRHFISVELGAYFFVHFLSQIYSCHNNCIFSRRRENTKYHDDNDFVALSKFFVRPLKQRSCYCSALNYTASDADVFVVGSLLMCLWCKMLPLSMSNQSSSCVEDSNTAECSYITKNAKHDSRQKTMTTSNNYTSWRPMIFVFLVVAIFSG